MRPPLELLFPSEIGVELIYSFVIILSSLMIYYSTKEMYELSSYKGIKYFRLSFLSFAIAYFFRYFLIFILNIFRIPSIYLNTLKISAFIFLYFSSMAIFYLLYSVTWKKLKFIKIHNFYLLALLISIIGVVFNTERILVMINLFLLIFIFFVLLLAYRQSKSKKNWMLGIYLMLFVFWILNVIQILIPRFLKVQQLIIYLASISLFMTILYRVLKKTGN